MQPTELRATDDLNMRLTEAEGMLDLMLEAYAAVDGKDIHGEQLFGDSNLQVQLTVIHCSVREAMDSAKALENFMKERGDTP
jgi:hypothetical protein